VRLLLDRKAIIEATWILKPSCREKVANQVEASFARERQVKSVPASFVRIMRRKAKVVVLFYLVCFGETGARYLDIEMPKRVFQIRHVGVIGIEVVGAGSPMRLADDPRLPICRNRTNFTEIKGFAASTNVLLEESLGERLLHPEGSAQGAHYIRSRRRYVDDECQSRIAYAMACRVNKVVDSIA
jgi:hypothetical protein